MKTPLTYKIFIFLIFLKLTAFGQRENYPVLGTATVSIPASASIADYSNPFTNPVNVKLFLTDPTVKSRQVDIQMSFYGAGISARSRKSAPGTSFELTNSTRFGVPKSVIAACFSPDALEGISPNFYQQPLPSGLYTFVFEIFDSFTGYKLAEPISTAPVWVEVSDPPLPIQPGNFSSVQKNQVQNLLFQWMPRHTPNPNIEYEFTLTELPFAKRGNLQNIFLSQPPVAKITTTQVNLIYDSRYPPLRKDAVYAWRVQAKPKFGQLGKTSSFLNEGYSEIFSFTYSDLQTKLNPPTDLKIAYNPDFLKLNIDWKGEDNHVYYLMSVVFAYNKYDKHFIETENGQVLNEDRKIIGRGYEEYETIEVDKGAENITKLQHKYFNMGLLKSDTRIAVRAVDAFGRVSEPAIYDLKGFDELKVNDIYSLKTSISGSVTAVVQRFKDGKIAENRDPLPVKKAMVCLCTTNEATLPNYNLEELMRYMGGKYNYFCSETKADGTYLIENIRLPVQVTPYKNTFLLVKSPTSDYSDLITKIEVPEQDGAQTKKMPPQQLVLNTADLRVDVKYPDGSSFDNSAFEEINLYRLKSVYEEHKILKLEAGENAKKEIRFNKNVYVKVGDVLKAEDFLTNQNTADNFVVGLKEFRKDEMFYPAEKVLKKPDSKRFVVTDDQNVYVGIEPSVFGNTEFRPRRMRLYEQYSIKIYYTFPKIKIYGKVRVKGSSKGQTLDIPNWEVGILVLKKGEDIREIALKRQMKNPDFYEKISWEKVVTNQNGYEYIIPEHISLNEDIQDIVIYNRIPGVSSYFQADRIGKPFTNYEHNIDLISIGTSVASIVKNENGEPVAGAIITHSSGAITSSNHIGEFVLNVQFSPAIEKDPFIKIMANNYISKSVGLSTLRRTDDTSRTSDFGLAFWTKQINELKTLSKTMYQDLGSANAFEENYKNYNTQLQTFYTQDSIGINANLNYIKIKCYTNNGTKKYIPSTLIFDGKQVDVPVNGIAKLLATSGTKLSGKVHNKDRKAPIIYLEENFEVTFDSPAHKDDTVYVEIKVKEAMLVAGTVVSYNIDSVRIGYEAGVKLSVEGLGDMETDENGKFEMWLEKNAIEVEIKLTKEKFNDASWAFSTKTKTRAEINRDFLKDKKDKIEYLTAEELRNLPLKIHQKDLTIPKFSKLQGFNISIEKILRVDSRTYLMSGSLDVSGEKGIYKLKEGEDLTFESLEVKEDRLDPTNAVLVNDEAKLKQETVNLLLFNYASVELNNQNGAFTNPLKLIKLKLDGRESYGKIGGVRLKFKPAQILKKAAEPILREFRLEPNLKPKTGLNNDQTAVNPNAPKTPQANTLKYEGRESSAEIIPIFVSGGKELTNFHQKLEFNLIYPEGINGYKRKDEKDDKGVLTGKKEKISIGMGAGFNVLLDESKEATLNRDGVVFIGHLGFPMMKKVGIEDHMVVVEKLMLAPKENLPMRELRLAKVKPDTAEGKPYYVRLGVAGSWRFEIDKIQVFDDFSNAGFGGKLFTDATNHLIVHSMAVRRANGNTYPFLDMEFPEKGFKIKSVVMKSPVGQHILLGYNFRDDAFEVEAGVRVEVENPSEAVKNIFPLEVEKFVYNTRDKLYLLAKLGKTVTFGPIKITIRKFSFNKGGAVSWSEMLNALVLDTREATTFAATTTFNTANYTTSNANSYMNMRQNDAGNNMMNEKEDVEIKNGNVDWAIGIAGSVEIERAKGMKTTGQASFVFGEKDNAFAIQFNTIEIKFESTACKGFMSLKLSTSGDRIGFEGEGDFETAKMKILGSAKLFKVPGGIEFGVAFVKSVNYKLGSITLTSFGGGIEANTATSKYAVFLLGSGHPTNLHPKIVEYRKIKLQVLFELEKCGILPVVSGSMEVYKQEVYACKGEVVLDLCRLTILLNVECKMELDLKMEKVMAEVHGTWFVTTDSYFMGFSLKAGLRRILPAQVTGLSIVSYDTQLVGADVPRQVAYYKHMIPNNVLIKNGTTIDGVYLKVFGEINWNLSGDFYVVSYSAKLIISNDFEIHIPFKEVNYYLKNDFKFELGGSVKVLGFPVSFGAYARLFILGSISAQYKKDVIVDYVSTLQGKAAAGIYVSAGLASGCNSITPFGFKICVDAGIGVLIHSQAGTSFYLDY